MKNLQQLAIETGNIDPDGQPTLEAKSAWIEQNLTDDDVSSWHAGKMTKHVQSLIISMNVDVIEIWGSNEGPEPLSVNIIN